MFRYFPMKKTSPPSANASGMNTPATAPGLCQNPPLPSLAATEGRGEPLLLAPDCENTIPVSSGGELGRAELVVASGEGTRVGGEDGDCDGRGTTVLDSPGEVSGVAVLEAPEGVCADDSEAVVVGEAVSVEDVCDGSSVNDVAVELSEVV